MGLNNTMRLATIRLFAVLAAAIMAVSLPAISYAQEAPAADAPQQPTLIRNIQVQGNQRVEANTVASYLLFAPGDPYSADRRAFLLMYRLNQAQMEMSLSVLLKTQLSTALSLRVISLSNQIKLRMKSKQSLGLSLHGLTFKQMCSAS